MELGCPNCKTGDNIYTMELMPVEYPVDLTREVECGYEYNGGDSRDFDEGAEPEKDEQGRVKLVCRNCDHEFAPDEAVVLDEPPDCPAGHGAMVQSNEPGGVVWACLTCGRGADVSIDEAVQRG